MTPLQNLEGRVEAFLGQLGLQEAFRPGGVTTIDAGDTVVLVTCFEQDHIPWQRGGTPGADRGLGPPPDVQDTQEY